MVFVVGYVDGGYWDFVGVVVVDLFVDGGVGYCW